MKSIQWLTLAVRFLISWSLVTIFFYFSGEFIIRILLPYLAFICNLLSQNYHTELFLGDGSQGMVINIAATVTHDIYQYNVPIAPTGARITAAGGLVHAMIPLVVLFSILLSIPTTFKRTLFQLAIGIPISIIILTCTTPVLLTSHIESIFYSALQNVTHKDMPTPLIMQIVEFMEIGGLWLFSLLGAVICILISAKINTAKIKRTIT